MTQIVFQTTQDHENLAMPLYIDQPAPSSTLPLDDLRQVYWSLTRQGHRLPAQPGIILIDGGAVAGAIATQPPPPDSGLRPIGPIITGIVRDLARQTAATATRQSNTPVDYF